MIIDLHTDIIYTAQSNCSHNLFKTTAITTVNGKIVHKPEPATGKSPTDPESNARYRRLDQLNPKWWRQAATLVATQTSRADDALKIVGTCLEITWFKRTVKIDPSRMSMIYLDDRQTGLGYQEGLVILTLIDYLSNHAKLPPDSELVNENYLTGGTTFFRGPHLMASIILARRFADNGVGFLKRAQLLGGQPAPYGEFGVEFEICPGLNWTIALWERDSEFPARAQYLFDRKLDQIFQLDVIWALGNLIAAKF